MHGQRLVFPMVLERAIETAPAWITERLLLLVRKLFIQAT